MELAELLARIEAAMEGSRELDWLIAEHFGDVPKHTVRTIGWDYDWYRKPDEFALWKATDAEGRSVALWQAEQVSTSVDKALALVERELPGWFWSIGFIDEEAATQEHHKHGAVVHPHWHVADRRDGLGHGATPPLAILAAMVRALLAKEA